MEKTKKWKHFCLDELFQSVPVEMYGEQNREKA